MAEALEWSRAEGLSVDDNPDYRREYQHLTLARALIAEARLHPDRRALRDVDQLLEHLLAAAETGGRGGAAIEILVLHAIVDGALGDEPASLAHLERAIKLAEPERYVRVFVDEGEPMRKLLRRAAANGIGGAYVRRLLTAFDVRTGARAAEPQPRVAGLAEPLTPREIEILRLIAAGMRNQEIADLLVISLPTVKRHIANGYGKLGATHRTEAVARATSLHLL